MRIHDLPTLFWMLVFAVVLISLHHTPTLFSLLKTPFAVLFGFIHTLLNSYSDAANVILIVVIVAQLLVSIINALWWAKPRDRLRLIILSLFPVLFSFEAYLGLFVFRGNIFVKEMLESIREIFAGILLNYHFHQLLVFLGEIYPEPMALRDDRLLFTYHIPFTHYQFAALPVTPLEMMNMKSLVSVYLYVRLYLAGLMILLYSFDLHVKWHFFAISRFFASISIYYFDVFCSTFKTSLASDNYIFRLASLESVFMICLFQELFLSGFAKLGIFDAEPELQHDIHYLLVIAEMTYFCYLQVKPTAHANGERAHGKAS